MMRKFYLIVAGMSITVLCNAANYFVDAVNGRDDINTGLSSASAYKTVQKAANVTNPGDTVFIMAGTYTNTGTVLNISRSGSATAQIVYTNYPGSLPKLQASATSYAVISFSPGTSYITINGLEISGNGVNLTLTADTIPAKNQLSCPVTGSPATSQTPLAKYNGHGITGDSRSVVIGSHHLVITNNKVHDCCAAGIGFLNADYLTIEGNTIYNNSWYTIYGTSGISFNLLYNYDDNNTSYRNIVRNNISYGNRMYVPFYNDCKVTDGNGVILDIPQTNYNGKSLVVNNICFNNGGSGIHSFRMNHVDIFHNISYLNAASPEINSSNIYALQSDDVKIYNNIIVARPGKRVNGVNSSTNLLYDYNIYYGTSPVDVVGTHSLIQDPKFVNASTDPAVADFRLTPSSPGVNAGDNTHSFEFDYAHNPRPFAGVVDIGPLESVYSGNTQGCSTAPSSIILSNGNGNGTGEASASFLYAIADTRPSVSNQKSRKAFIYPSTLLTGIPANSTITSLKFRRAIQISPTNTNPSSDSVPLNSNFRVYLRNEAGDNFGTAAFDWTTILPPAGNPATMVYGGEAATIIGNAGGWKEIIFQVPFLYTGNNLGVFVEYVQSGNIGAAPDINWIYDNGGTQPRYNVTSYPNMVNAFKSNSASGNTALSNTLTTTNERRPVVTISYCSNILLPVTFSGFNAVNKNNNVLLTWSTGTEINNTLFEIERSVNGIDFVTIGQVTSRAVVGNSAGSIRYQFIDEQPLNSKSYYRLAQKDFNGSTTFSPILSLTIEKLQNAITIQPNPVKAIMQAFIQSNAPDQWATIQIQDFSGRILHSFSKRLAQGKNSVNIDLAKQPTGSYLMLVVLPSGEKFLKKFIKN